MPPAIIYCSTCGAGSGSQALFCFNCGQKLQSGTPPPLLEASAPDETLAQPTGCLPPHQMLHQRYSIVHLLGQGGMGAVYKARDTQFGGRRVAIKEMSLSNLTAQEVGEAEERFKQEAHLLARLTHPNLPSVYDYFEAKGRWYLVMDFIKGETLEDYCEKASNRILPTLEVIEIGIQLAKVLGYLHTRPTPIIFRDLKPLNIMITPEKHIYLIDFGIARLFKHGKAKDTHVYGSVGYAAPEQFGKTQTNPRSDIYSLGVILYQLLSGQDPQENEPIFHFPPLQTYNSTLPAELTTLISYMVHMDQRLRPGSMVGVRRELERIRNRLRNPSSPMPSSRHHHALSAQRPQLPQLASPASQPVHYALSPIQQIRALSLPRNASLLTFQDDLQISLPPVIIAGLFCLAIFVLSLFISLPWLVISPLLLACFSAAFVLRRTCKGF